MHTVEAGEVLGQIAERYAVTVEAIIEANALESPDRIFPGDELVIPASTNQSSPTTTAATQEGTRPPLVHTVEAGQLLSTIAERYGVTVAEIVEANGLGSADLIFPGDELIIPISTNQ